MNQSQRAPAITFRWNFQKGTELQTVQRSPQPSSFDTAAMPAQMAAGVIAAQRRAELQSVSPPVLHDTDILVRIEGCGICGSNLPVWEGRPWFTYPLQPGAPGHEAWGTIEAVGSCVTEFRNGDRVAMLSNHGFAEYDTVAAGSALLLPNSLGDIPFPGEPLACAMNIARRSAVASGENVAIVGIGFLGALLTRLAKFAGARVAAVSRRPFAREVAVQCGADAVFEWRGDSAIDLARWTQGTGFDCVIESVGSQASLDLATQITKERGRLIIAGYHQDGLRTVDLQLWNWRGLDVINAHERDSRVYLDGMRAALEAVLNGTLNPTPLYTHCFPLDELGSAFEMLRTRPDGFIKALVIP